MHICFMVGLQQDRPGEETQAASGKDSGPFTLRILGSQRGEAHGFDVDMSNMFPREGRVELSGASG